MSGLVLALLMSVPSVFGEEVVLRNDVNYSDTYNPGEPLVWLEFPECAISVLRPDAADLPLEVHTIQVFLGSNRGRQVGRGTVIELGIQVLEDGQTEPTGRGNWHGTEVGFDVTVSNDYLNELPIDDPELGLPALELTSPDQSIAVWVCPPDPETGYEWPSSGQNDTSGIVLHGSSPSEGNFLVYQNQIYPTDLLGIPGSWIIRAVAGEGSGNPGGDDTGNPSGGDDTGNPHVDGDFYIQSITPASAAQGESVDVVILGDGFVAGTEARIGGISLTGTDVVSAETILGRTPSSLPAGLHDVELILPNGESDYLAQAFEVTGGCACSAHDGYSGRSVPLVAFALLGLVALRRRD